MSRQVFAGKPQEQRVWEAQSGRLGNRKCGKPKVADSEQCILAVDSSTCQETNFECSWPSTLLLEMSYVLYDASTFSGETKIKSFVVSCRRKINLMTGAVVAQKVISCGHMGACGFMVSRGAFVSTPSRQAVVLTQSHEIKI